MDYEIISLRIGDSQLLLCQVLYQMKIMDHYIKQECFASLT